MQKYWLHITYRYGERKQVSAINTFINAPSFEDAYKQARRLYAKRAGEPWNSIVKFLLEVA